MVTIPENFCGYVSLDDNLYVCSVNGHFVKILPAFEGKEKNAQAISGLTPKPPYTEDSSDYIYGKDESLHQIALLYRDIEQLATDGYHFFAPIIIKSNGNGSGFYSHLTKDWKQYDAIMFSGGIIDSLYNPKLAALEKPAFSLEELKDLLWSDGAHSIAIKPFSDYTHIIDVVIDGQKAKLMISVSHGEEGNINTTDLGSLKSLLQLQFDNPQEFITIEKYIRIIKKTLAVLARQYNIAFDVSIKQRTEDDKYMQTGFCKVFINNEDYYKPQNHQVVSIQCLLDYLPEIIKIVGAGEAETILALLPMRNEDRKYVSITNVQDLCTALEAEYDLSVSKQPTAKDTAIQELKKKIKSVIKEFAINNTIDPNKETTISSCFQYLDLNLKNKIHSLYVKHKAAVDAVRQKHRLPDMTVEAIEKFVDLRNTKAHTGKIAWSDNVDQYTALFALVYCCFFARAGIPDEKLTSFLAQLF